MWCWCILNRTGDKGKEHTEVWIEERNATVGRGVVLKTDKGIDTGWRIAEVGLPEPRRRCRSTCCDG